MSLWLSEDEVVELTGYRQRSKQRVALALMGVRFTMRAADGFPLVERAAVLTTPKAAAKTEPNWDALRA